MTRSMERGLYIAASGMLAEQIRQDQIANDMANATTPGYKADRTSQRGFGELLLANSATGAPVGPQGTAVQVSAVETDFSPQPAKDTGEPLDFAIVGEGFFAV
jgi:flagellar basal-body rod protein FlgF